MKTYVTFGQTHVHQINGKTIDKNCVVVINGDRNKVFELFGNKFSCEYPEHKWNEENLKYYPRGYIEI
jgi:hypothetical protein